MSWIDKNILKPITKKNVEEKIVEEVVKEETGNKPYKTSHTERVDITKERFIVGVMYLLIFVIFTSFCAMTYLFAVNDDSTGQIFKEIFMYCLTALVSYVLGYNKNK